MRHRIDKLLWSWRPGRFTKDAKRRLLILSVPGPISQSQIFPFHFYREALRQAYGVEMVEFDTSRFEVEPDRTPGGADIVMVQTWLDLTLERSERLFGSIRQRNPSAKIIYLDSFAPTDLRFAHLVNSHVDLYVKKHVLRDRSLYGKPTMGDTNLSDYYSRLYGLNLPNVAFPIPEGFLRKLVVGPTFWAGRTLLPHFYDWHAPPKNAGTIDVHARLGASGDDWYGRMRRDAVTTLQRISDLKIAEGANVPVRRYLQELTQSKICFSPFGYGEVCWRDYEAISRGAMLLKPDMSHLETDPNIFIPDDSYVSIAWDFSDLEEKIRHFLRNDAGRNSIVSSAYKKLHEYATNQYFVHQIGDWLKK